MECNCGKDLHVGSIVRLLSGGLKMTVEAVENNKYTGKTEVSCVWIDKINTARRARFFPQVLKLASPPKPKTAP